jgi:hypothetical protein
MHGTPSSAQLSDPEWQRRQSDSARLSLALMKHVKQSVGPLSREADPVLRSRAARNIATMYLSQLRPVGPPDH